MTTHSTRLDPSHFVLPLDVSRLQNDCISLIPFKANISPEFNLERNLVTYYEAVKHFPGLFQWLVYGPWDNFDQFRDYWMGRFAQTNDTIWFLIILKKCTIHKRERKAASSGSQDPIYTTFDVEDGTFAGTIGLCDPSMKNSLVEIGHALTLPQFHGTFVTTTAHAMLLKHLLDPAPQDLQLRRVNCEANTQNPASVASAKHFGFVVEGTARYDQALAPGKSQSTAVDDRPGKGVAGKLPEIAPDGSLLGAPRNTVKMGLCWDDWLVDGKEKIEALLDPAARIPRYKARGSSKI